MEHKIYRVTECRRTGNHSLLLSFDDGISREIDFSSVLNGELYEPLRLPEYFGRVRLDEEVGTIVWPNDADFDPAILHDWPDFSESFKK
jgi:hypothetical protein